MSSDSFKSNVRDALIFITSAESLGFNLFLSDSQKVDIISVNAYFTSVGDRIALLLQLAVLRHHRKDQITADSENSFNRTTALEITKCLSFLKSFEMFMLQNSSPSLLCMKDSIERALAKSTAAVLSLLTDLNSYAKERQTSSASGPSILTSLCEDYQLCDLLSVLDEFLPITDSNLKFVSMAYKFKSAISQISNSTRHKIPIHDFDGVLNDLKNFGTGNLLVAAELRGIVQEVYATLSTMLKRDSKTAESFRLGATSHEATVALLDSLHEIAEKSSLFVKYLADDQIDEHAKMKSVSGGVNSALRLVCSDCKSRVGDLKVALGESSFYETETMLASATVTLPLIEQLAGYIKGFNTPDIDLSPQVNRRIYPRTNLQ